MENVLTQAGEVRGVELDGVRRFGGIPFAAPPVGDLRWVPPQPAARWSGVRDATGFGGVAIQTIDTGAVDLRGTPSEDCLYLNVWTAAEAGSGRPVMVWIHGGGFLNGSGSATMYDGAALARRGVVVVTFNYRLGAFGFLTDPGLGANFGLLDQVAALRWVQANVAAFGGDPDNVTVFGQSAGGASVRALLSTPSAAGLFARGIIESGGFEDYAVVASPGYDRSARASARLFELLGTTDHDALRRIPTEQVRAASFEVSGLRAPDEELHTPANLTWYPVADGTTLIADEFPAWPEGAPVMLGVTANEGRFFAQPHRVYGNPGQRPEDMYTSKALGRLAKTLSGPAADEVMSHYADLDQDAYASIADLMTKAIWLEPAQATARRFVEAGRDVYAVEFERVSPGAERSGMLAAHMSEIPYVFGAVAGAEGYDGTDEAVQDTMQHAWVSFATDGVPRFADGSPWPRFRSDAEEITIVGDEPRVALFDLEPAGRALAGARADRTTADA